MEQFYINPERSSSIEIIYTHNGSEFKQNFASVKEAIEEAERLHSNKVLFELWVDGDANWDYKITNKPTNPEGQIQPQIGSFYIVKKSKQDSGCKSGFFGYIGHYVTVQIKLNRVLYYGLDAVEDVEIGGLSPLDHEMADAYVESGSIKGIELTDAECDYISDHHSDWVYEKAVEQVY